MLRLPDDGPLLTDADANDLIGSAWGAQADVVAVPVARLDPAFFELASGVAGELTQKFVNYHLVLAVVGDVRAHEERSSAFAAWVVESNRGRHVWFVVDDDALTARL